jgi:hypothetical protein
VERARVRGLSVVENPLYALRAFGDSDAPSSPAAGSPMILVQVDSPGVAVRPGFWRRVARLLAKLTALFVSLPLAVLAQDGQKGETIRVRFLDKHEETVEVIDWNAKGLTLRLKDVPKPVFFEWWKLDPATAEALQRRYLGKTEGPADPGLTLEGVRVRTANRVVEGVPIPDAPPDELRIRNAEGVWTFKLADVLSKETVRLRLTQVYTPNELYKILLDRLQPVEPVEWDKLAAELIRIGLPDRAEPVIRIGELLRRPELPEGKLYRDLVKLRERLDDLSLKKSVFQVQEQFLAGRYQESIEAVESLEKAVTDEALLADLRRVRTELQMLRDQSRDEQIIAEWFRTIDILLRSRAFDRAVSYRDAAEYVKSRMADEVLKAVSDRFGITKGDGSAKIVWEGRSPKVILKHSYGEASWVVARPELGNVEPWWTAADDAARYAVLKGLAIETHFRVVRVGEKNCPTCGGEGAVDRAKYPNVLAGVCPSCRGLKHERTVFYR